MSGLWRGCSWQACRAGMASPPTWLRIITAARTAAPAIATLLEHGMKVLVVYCHPCEQSFNAAVRDAAIDILEKRGQEVHLVDLYAAGFDPVMSMEEWHRYFRDEENFEPIRDQAQYVLWA